MDGKWRRFASPGVAWLWARAGFLNCWLARHRMYKMKIHQIWPIIAHVLFVATRISLQLHSYVLLPVASWSLTHLNESSSKFTHPWGRNNASSHSLWGMRKSKPCDAANSLPISMTSDIIIYNYFPSTSSPLIFTRTTSTTTRFTWWLWNFHQFISSKPT